MNSKFDELLEKLPQIASAVNAFQSEALQVRALEALLTQFGLTVAVEDEGTRPDSGADDVQQGANADKPSANGKSNAASKVRKPSKKSQTFSMVKDLQLEPTNLEGLREFYARKAPSDFQENAVVFVYYLERVLERPNIGPAEVYTCYKHVDARVPGDVLKSIVNAGFRKGWLDTSDTKNLKVTVHGENFVERDLPAAPKKPK